MAQLPQQCPKCKADLRDPKVPSGYDPALFSMVLSDETQDQWVCPVCRHRWKRGRKPSRRMRRKAQVKFSKTVRKAQRAVAVAQRESRVDDERAGSEDVPMSDGGL